MMKIFTLKLNWIVLVIVFIMSMMVVSKIHALTPDEAAKKYNLSFPIPELGNCANFGECKEYCEDPLHQSVCIDFAKKKGFYKEDKKSLKNAIINAAKQQLGCNSEDSCKAFCGEQENWEKCGEFAKKHKLSGGHLEDPAKKEILAKAKEVLGCDSYNSCKSFCEADVNKQKCDEFAKLVGLRGGEEHKGPGGCTSLETCKAFCAEPENFQVCQGFASSNGENFKGPGGCGSEESCKSYCKEHEAECKKYFLGVGSLPPGFDKYEICSRTPTCKWIDDKCECKSREEYKGSKALPAFHNAEEHARFCREYPQKCTSPTEQYNPKIESDPAKKCVENGCSWTGTYCNCENKSPYPSYSPKPTQSPYPTSTPKVETTTGSSDGTFCEDSDGNGNYTNRGTCTDKDGTRVDYCESDTARDWYCSGTWNGTSWSNKHCEAGGYVCSSFGKVCSEGACVSGSSGSSSTPYPSYSPTTSGNTGTSSSVKGVSLVRSFLQTILDWISK